MKDKLITIVVTVPKNFLVLQDRLGSAAVSLERVATDATQKYINDLMSMFPTAGGQS